jgi:hypothetical protein
VADRVDVIARRDAILRAGRHLLVTTGVERALARHGNVHHCGSFFVRLALRPEIDLLLLVPGPAESAVASVAATLTALPGAKEVDIGPRRRPAKH